MIRKTLRLPGLALFLGASLLLSACGGDEPTPTPTATKIPAAGPTATPTRAPIPTPTVEPMGTLEMRVTDLPNPAITAIIIVAEEIQVHRTSDGEWVTVVEGPFSFDLIALAGVEAILGSQPLAPDTYTQIRLRIASATIVEGGVETEASVPSDTIKVVRPLTIRAGETTIATLDFDAERSVVSQGNGRFQLKPVIKLLVRKEGEPFQPESQATTTATPTATATATLTPAESPTPTATPTATPEPTGEFFLYIEAPETTESIVAEASLTVVGRTRIDAVVSVGDVFAEVDEDGRFRVPVQLQEGPNIIEVVVSLESGEELVEILVVVYSP